MAPNPNNEPGFVHRNDTVDYVFVIEGELELGTTSGEVKLVKAGEVVVQRGGNRLFRSVPLHFTGVPRFSVAFNEKPKQGEWIKDDWGKCRCRRS
jgi:hypothetical protein